MVSFHLLEHKYPRPLLSPFEHYFFSPFVVLFPLTYAVISVIQIICLLFLTTMGPSDVVGYTSAPLSLRRAPFPFSMKESEDTQEIIARGGKEATIFFGVTVGSHRML